MHIFYCTQIENETAILSAEESAHCIRVLRLGKGDGVWLIDGKGNSFEAVITLPDANKCQLKVIKSTSTQPPRNSKLHIAIAPTKSIDRFEWFVEKAVETGIDIITPLLCQRSERRVLKTERLEKLIISTMKQAKIFYKPVVNELIEYQKFISNVWPDVNNRYIASCNDNLNHLFNENLNNRSDIIIMIGPEGDFSPAEIALAEKYNFRQISLGPNRLRTETAGIIACHTINLVNQLMLNKLSNNL